MPRAPLGPDHPPYIFVSLSTASLQRYQGMFLELTLPGDSDACPPVVRLSATHTTPQPQLAHLSAVVTGVASVG